MEPGPASQGTERRRVRISYIVLFGFLAVAGFFLILEHRAHLLGWLPFAIILLCPLMHIFMHGSHRGHGGGHGGHDGHGPSASDADTSRSSRQRQY